MSERKRRPPSSKVKPGTPHPTKAYTVRGYDGRWISTKAFNAAKRARQKAAQKGGALVKRTSSAVTKVAKSASDLLKIQKGDKGIVRAVKDVYKLGKDTRKSANALYKAGKITREVHDKLVKGGKDFVGGVREAGKATRRAYEKTKPGGKIVRVSKDAPKFKFEALPKQKGGAIVKTKGSAVTKAKSTKGGKLTTTRKPTYLKDTLDKKAKQDAATKASNAKKAARREAAKMKQTRAAAGSQNVKKEWNPKTQKWETRYGSGTTKPRQRSPYTKAKSFVTEKGPKFAKNVKDVASKINKNTPKGVKSALKIGGKGVNWLVKPLAVAELVDETAGAIRQGGNIYRRSQNKPLLKDLKGWGQAEGFQGKVIDAKNKYLKEHGSLKGFWEFQRTGKKPNNQVQKTDTKKTTNNNQSIKIKDNSSQPKGWNARNLAKKKAQSEKKLANIDPKEGNATLPGRDKSKSIRINPDFGKKSEYGNKSKESKSGTTRMHPLEKANRARFGDEAVDTLKIKHSEWKKARKAGTLDAWEKKWHPNRKRKYGKLKYRGTYR